jgi:type IV pilus assembly protein PilV
MNNPMASNSTLHRGPRRNASGFTLLEVLIAVLILSIGLLGLAGLQITSLKFNHSAYMRTAATNLAYDMTDRMRVNRGQALTGAYDGVDFPDPPEVCDPSLTPDGSAAQDILTWRHALICALPAGTGSIERTDNNLVTITVRWDDSRGEEGAQEFSMMTRL